jgi:hypothetical protein
MTPLDHASAHELLADLALEPGSLERLAVAPDEEWAALIAHLAVCGDCRREAEAARRTEAAIVDAAAGAGGLAAIAADRPIRPPASLRAAVASIPGSAAGPGAGIGDVRVADRGTAASVGLVVRAPVAVHARRSGGARTFALVGLAAAIVVGVAIGSIAVDATGRAASATADRERLQVLIGHVEAILAVPAHVTVPLRTADGAPAGTIAWTDSEIAVVATGLAAPAAGTTYRCWVERGGVRTAIGEMTIVGSTASWVGSVDAWGTISFSGGGRFGVSLEPGTGGISGPAILVADLPS